MLCNLSLKYYKKIIRYKLIKLQLSMSYLSHLLYLTMIKLPKRTLMYSMCHELMC